MSDPTYLDLADPAFDVTSAAVHEARERDWYARDDLGLGGAALRRGHGALLKDRRFRQGNARWPAQNGMHSGLFAELVGETLLSLEGDDHARIRRLLGARVPQPGDRRDATAVPGARRTS